MLKHLKGGRLYVPVATAAATGMRRGEVLGIRWRDIDLKANTLSVVQVVEKTRKTLMVKEPKTEGSRRTIALPPSLVRTLAQYKKEQAAWRLRSGLGKGEDLVFPSSDGALRNPDYFSKAFSREVAAVGLQGVTFHGLRHTHISELLKRGVPVDVVAARAGHANPTITLNIYSHLLPGQQEQAAAIIDGYLRAALED